MPDGLKPRDFRSQRVGRTPPDIVPGDIDAADQPLGCEYRDLPKRRVPDDKMPSQFLRARAIGLKHGVLAHMKDRHRRCHRHRRQAPQQDQKFCGDAAAAPISAADHHGDPGEFADRQRYIPPAADQHEIRIIEIGADKDEDGRHTPKGDRGETCEHARQPRCDGGRSAGLRETSDIRDFVSLACADPRLHKTCKTILKFCQGRTAAPWRA